ncbi:nickel pincer cofactor biosynthesis protein LarC [Metallumcola ferriviriculae]|uniref:Pyridinium-3,5-bisthiocarboxylic acid mononucleotide nickel insertion protein n=1 Tax=Metallumcola ferriviriculae TaxID=3039180 RepID=A0AAU0UKC8_9FIRM|nr:nickel pincer cofactor biosynthesis protein LarC [Desulfitibacteraceae bacterium MK1]
MKTAHFQCLAGISGDMILGALVDAGLEFDRLKEEISKLNIADYALEQHQVVKNGISGTKVDVIINETNAHRHLRDIEKIITGSGLSPSVKEKCIVIFHKIAAAEAKVHNTTVEKIHFHEVGSLDAVIDVAGSVAGLELLGVEKVTASKVHVGTGFTKCAHGQIPLPAPATLELLQGVPVYCQGIEKELVTPTGAAIITALADAFGEMPAMSVTNIGYGAGTRDLQIPNLLRLSLGDSTPEESGGFPDVRFNGSGSVRQREEVMVEVNIDDYNPEFYDYLFNRLFAQGAHDVFLQPIQMKKNRPAVKLNVLTHQDKMESILETIFRETSTIGVRAYPVTKYMLPYEIKTLATKYGDIKVKVASLNNKTTSINPEYEDCRAKAELFQEPVKVVYEYVKSAAQHAFAKK